MFDSETYEAQIIGSDPAWVVAVGSPLGLRLTVAHGIISAKERGLAESPLVELIQTDTPINPGNSGGPLLNLKGEVIGITSAKVKGEGIEGIGFAIPINTAKEIVSELKTKGRVIRGWLGIGYIDTSNLPQAEIEISKKRFELEKMPERKEKTINGLNK